MKTAFALAVLLAANALAAAAQGTDVAVELKETVDPAYDLDAMRVRETPVKYGRKSRSR